MNQGANVLVVDDEESIRYTLKFFLEEAGHKVAVARDRRQALASLSQIRFQVAVVDLGLGGEDGLSLLQDLKERQPQCLAILITARPSLDSTIKVMKQDVFGYLVKPVEAEAIRYLVAQAAGGSGYDKELREQLHRLLSLVDGSPHPILIRDLKGGPLHFNAAFQRRFGYNQLDLRQGLEPFVPPWDREKTQADIQALLSGGGTSLERETLRVGKDGRLLDVAMTITLGRDTAGRPRELLFVFRDNSRVAQLESRLRHMEKMAALGEMVGGMAHEFNNFLTAISGFAQLGMFSATPGDPQHVYLDKIDKISQRAMTLIKRVLAYSRRPQDRQGHISLAAVLREGVDLLRETLPANIEIECHIQEGGGKVAAEDIQIHQILNNLCTNAAHAMEQGGRLTIRLQEMELKGMRSGAWVGLPAGYYQELTVSDTGHGMEPEVLERIFEAFYTTKDSESGTGLGLALVQGLVRELGGAINAESQPGQGTCFRVILPCRRRHEVPAPVSRQPAHAVCHAASAQPR